MKLRNLLLAAATSIALVSPALAYTDTESGIASTLMYNDKCGSGIPAVAIAFAEAYAANHPTEINDAKSYWTNQLISTAKGHVDEPTMWSMWCILMKPKVAETFSSLR